MLYATNPLVESHDVGASSFGLPRIRKAFDNAYSSLMTKPPTHE
jgi:hypothetical protein